MANIQNMNLEIRKLANEIGTRLKNRVFKATTSERDALTVAQATEIGAILNTTTGQFEKYDAGSDSWSEFISTAVFVGAEFLNTAADVTAAQADAAKNAASPTIDDILFELANGTYLALPMDKLITYLADPADTFIYANNGASSSTDPNDWIKYLDVINEVVTY